MGIGGTLILLILSLVFGRNFFSFFSGGPAADTSTSGYSDRQAGDSGQQVPPANEAPGEHKEVQFVSFVLDDVQRNWENLLPRSGATYRHAKLVLFRDYIQSGCGGAETATGPFYCPADERVYLDLGFFDELKSKFGAPGEFAQAYVVAHEIGHHVQKILGIERQVRRLQQQDPGERNALSVRLELQADCFVGVWGHSTEKRNIIDESDVSAGLRAAAAVGDDRLQKMATGHVSPESFTHGSSAQRMEWFRRGLEQGAVSACDTFNQ